MSDKRGEDLPEDGCKPGADAEEITLPPDPRISETIAPCSFDPHATQPEIPIDDVSVESRVRYFGDYELLEEIARGGMGVVYKARQTNLDRIVAIKMILAGQFAGEDDVQRFKTEAEAAAQLDHPGIVPIFEIGEHKGQNYFSMGYIEGESLAHRVADGPMVPKSAADMVKRICDAISYAHEKGVVHRDLKPANILIDEKGDPKVTDFGLAKRTDTDSNLTGTGQILGTPSYMPPEQAAGKVDDIGPLADVYSLGAILYFLLTGRPPFQSANPLDTIMQVLDKEPMSARALNDTTPKDLDTIVSKCLAKSPGRRYESAKALHQELERYLSGKPISARPVSSFERGWRWCKRKPAVATVIAMTMLLLVLFAVGGPSVAIQQARLRQQAIDEREANRRLWYTSDMNLAKRAIDDDQSSIAKETLDRHTPLAGLTDLREFEWYYLSSLLDNSSSSFEVGNSVHLAATSPDGKLLAVGGVNGISVWNLEKLTLVDQPEKEPVTKLLFSPSGETLMWQAYGSTTPLRWDAATGKSLPSYSRQSHNFNALPVQDWKGTNIALRGFPVGLQNANDQSPVIQIRDVSDLKLVTTLEKVNAESSINPGAIVKFHPTENWVLVCGGRAAGTEEKTDVVLVDISTNNVVKTLTGHTADVRWAAFSKNGRSLMTAGTDQSVRIWNVLTGELRVLIDGFGSPLKHVVIDEECSRIAVVSGDSILLYDALSGSKVTTLRGQTSAIASVSFDPDGSVMAISTDGILKRWDADTLTGDRSITRLGQSDEWDSVQFSNSMQEVWVLNNSEVSLVNIGDGKMRSTYPTNSNIRQHTMSPSADRIALVERTQENVAFTRIIDFSTKTEICSVPYHAFEFDAKGERLLCFDEQHNGPLLLEIETGKHVQFLLENKQEYPFSRLSRDNQYLFVSYSQESGYSTTDVFDTESQRRLFSARYEGSGGGVYASSDAMFAQSVFKGIGAGTELKVLLWNIHTGEQVHAIQIPYTIIDLSFDFHPNGRRLLIASGSLLKIYDVNTGREVLTLDNMASIAVARFAPDGNSIRAIGRDGIVKTWSVDKKRASK